MVLEKCQYMNDILYKFRFIYNKNIIVKKLALNIINGMRFPSLKYQRLDKIQLILANEQVHFSFDLRDCT